MPNQLVQCISCGVNFDLQKFKGRISLGQPFTCQDCSPISIPQSQKSAIGFSGDETKNEFFFKCPICTEPILMYGRLTGTINSSAHDNYIECPNCENIVKQPDTYTDSDGKIHFGRVAFKVLTGNSITPETLDALKQTIIEYSDKRDTNSNESLIAEIKQLVPEVDDLTDLMIPTNPGEFWAFMGFIIALVTCFLSLKAMSATPPIVINNFFNIKDSEDVESVSYFALYKQGQLTKETLCPCGSGEQYQFCHFPQSDTGS